MNVKQCQSFARRVDQITAIRGRLRFHNITPIPYLRTSSRGTLLEHYPRRWASTKQGSKKDIADLRLPFKSHTVTTRPSTLDPTKFTRNDVLDLSGTDICVMNVCGQKAKLGYKSFGSAVTSEHVLVPFPPGTKGVFYFYDRTTVHPVAGDVRFRILPLDKIHNWSLVDSSEIFAEGEDLLGHDGFRPWHISLLSIIYKQRPCLLQLLKQCGYISRTAETEVERLRLSIAATGRFAYGIDSQIVDKIIDPFIIDLGLSLQPIVLLQQEGITSHKLGIEGMTSTRIRERRDKYIAYSGTVLGRFEMIRHEERNRIVLRVLKFLKPPNPNDAVFQEEGEFLKNYSLRKRKEKTWMANSNMNCITPSSMKLLEETYLSKATI